MQTIKSIYFCPHKDGKGLHVLVPQETYLYIYKQAKAHYDKLSGSQLDFAVQSEINFPDDIDTHRAFLSDILPIQKEDVIFERRIVKKISVLEMDMFSFGMRLDYGDKLYVGANVGKDHIPTVSSPSNGGFISTQPTLFHYPLFMMEHWFGANENDGEIPDNWVEELSNNIECMFDRIQNMGLMYKIYFWFNLRQYLQPEFFWEYTENSSPIPPFSIYDEKGNELDDNIDDFDSAQKIAKHIMSFNQHEFVTIENVFHNDVMCISEDLES